MTTSRCERCGAAEASVMMTCVESHEPGGSRMSDAPFRYCRPCARILGIGAPEQVDREGDHLSPPPTWSEVEQLVEELEIAMRHHPAMREAIVAVAQHVPRYAEVHARRVGAPVPATVMEALSRLGVDVAR